MRLSVLPCLLCFVAPPALGLEMSDLHGTWKLVSSVTKFTETGEERNTIGSSPMGYITYGPDGRMMTVATSNDRPNVGSATKLTDEDRTKLFKTMWAYAGTYTVDGNAVTHNVDTSWNEFWNGNKFTRMIEVKDGKLVFTTKPQLSVQNGKTEVLTLVWEKVK